MRFKGLFFCSAVVAALVLTAASGAGTSARRACTTKLVTESSVVRQPHNSIPTNNWVLYTRGAAASAFAQGPATPPLNGASLQIQTPAGDANAKAYLFNYDHDGTLLNTVSEISYATYRSSASTGSPLQVPALNLEIDYNGPNVEGGYAMLVFEPIYTYGNNAVVSDTWQTWDAFNGGTAKWWTPTSGVPGLCSFNCYATWNDIVSANQNATIVGGFGVNVGGGNPGLNVAADALHIAHGTTCVTYDFDVDGDGDGVADASDNCPTTPNANQADQDGDNVGDVCDPDVDGDGVANASDNCPATANPDQADFDRDGIGDACDTPSTPPSSKEQCKNGGWQNWKPRFKNQGDCVQYFNTGK